MKKSIYIIALIFYLKITEAQTLYFPPISGDDWEAISPESLGWCTEEIEPLYNYLDETNSKAFLVLKDGKIVLEKYFDTFTKDSIWYWASAAKSLTAFMVGIAQQEGYLSIDDTTSQYLGEGWTDCTEAQEEKITIRNQLTMTSGLDDGVENNHCTLDSCLIYKADAGNRWAYHNAPYTLLDSVIYSATGSELNTYIFNKLSLFTGIYGLFVKIDYDNIFLSTARYMARFGLLALNKGNWDGVEILTDTSYFNEMVNTSQSLNLAYGYLWWLNGKSSFMVPTLQFIFPGSLIPNAPEDMFSALGKNGQIIHIVPQSNLVVVRMGDAVSEDEVTIQYADTIWQKLNAIICTDDFMQPNIDKNNFSIVPNPAHDFFTIKQNFNSEKIVTVLDATGKIISRKQGKDEFTFNISALTKGIYFVRIETAEGISLKKVCKL